jgi:hypothetical protein
VTKNEKCSHTSAFVDYGLQADLDSALLKVQETGTWSARLHIKSPLILSWMGRQDPSKPVSV